MDEKALEKVAEARTLFEREVYAPHFAEKCAELGEPFPDEESLQAAIDTVRHIKQAVAQQSASLAKSAHSDLSAALGLVRPEAKVAAEKATEKAAEAAKLESFQAAFKTIVAASKAA